MNKKLILTLALMGISGSICGMGAQKVAQASRFSWAAIKASMPTWGKAYSKAKQQVQSPYRPASVNFRPLGAVIAGSAIASTTMGVAQAKAAPTVFNVENIDKHPEMKASFASFIAENLATPINARVANDNLVKGIVHFINTYPDQVPQLAAIARIKGTAVHKDIQQALASHDKTFKCTSYLSPSVVAGEIAATTTIWGVVEGIGVLGRLPMIDQNIINPVENPDLARKISQGVFNDLSLTDINKRIMSPESASWTPDERSTWRALRNYAGWLDEGTKLGINKQTLKNGCVEYSPSYDEAWSVAGKNLRTNLGKDIACGVATNMVQSIAIEMLNEKINDKKVSKAIVDVAKPLVENAYNNQFTLRNNMRAVVEGGLTFGIGELILDNTNITKAISIPAYNKNGYNFSHYGKRFAQWTLTNMFVPTFSSVIANAVCTKAFGPKPVAIIPAASMKIGDY